MDEKEARRTLEKLGYEIKNPNKIYIVSATLSNGGWHEERLVKNKPTDLRDYSIGATPFSEQYAEIDLDNLNWVLRKIESREEWLKRRAP